MLGFAVKVGLVPFQIWLPRGYAAAPGPARAIMAGVAVNVGFYGLWRTLALLGPPPAWLTGTLLVLASLTAVLGIAHAAVQPELQRVIAYSSVENTGLILAGFGVALAGAASANRLLVAAGLLAATLQVIAHIRRPNHCCLLRAPRSNRPRAPAIRTICAGRCGGCPGAVRGWRSAG